MRRRNLDASQCSKKTAQAFRRAADEEVARLIGRILRDRQRLGSMDLEASEMAIRAAMHQLGGVLLKQLVNSNGGGHQGAHIDCSQGHQAEFVDYRRKKIITVLAPVDVVRAYYHCATCHGGMIPKDGELDIAGTSLSPGVRRMVGHVGSLTVKASLQELNGRVGARGEQDAQGDAISLVRRRLRSVVA